MGEGWIQCEEIATTTFAAPLRCSKSARYLVTFTDGNGSTVKICGNHLLTIPRDAEYTVRPMMPDADAPTRAGDGGEG